MIFAGMLGRGPRGGGGGFRPGPGPGPGPGPRRVPHATIFRRQRPRQRFYASPSYYAAELLPYAWGATACTTHPTPPPPCTGTLFWRDANTVCCMP
jgi:hypothetical protein